VRVYLELARIPGLLRITASQLFARFPLGILSLAILLHVQRVSGSYALAGLVVGSVSAGEAVVVPLTSRLLGRWGIRPTTAVSCVVCAGAIAAISMTGLQPAAYVFVGFVAGASIPPIMPAVRALYPQFVAEHHVRALFSLDTASQELIWIGGPVVATVLSTTVSTAAPLLLAAAVTFGGGLWFISSPRLAGVQLKRSASRFGRVLGNRTMLLAMAISLAMVASFAALEIAVVAHLRSDGALAGVAIAVSSLGSLVGGAAFGSRTLGLTGLTIALTGITGFTALSAVAPDLWLLLPALFCSGLGFAPALATIYAMVSQALREQDTPEAFGWLNTGSLVGGACGTALAGSLSDGFGAQGAFSAATALALAGVVVPLVVALRQTQR